MLEGMHVLGSLCLALATGSVTRPSVAPPSTSAPSRSESMPWAR
jgi:hypothetical protein